MIKVLIVDDSALIRSLLTEIFSAEADMNVIGVAPNSYVARDMVNQFAPDVITLDIEMPKVDGLTFLDRLMKARPTPVVMISTLTERGADATLRALELGAIDFVAKPKVGVSEGIEAYRVEIVEKVREAAKARVKKRTTSATAQPLKISYTGTEKIIAIGASTGGTEAIKTVLNQLPANCPAVVITQHMPPGFTSRFADRLNKTSQMNVMEASDRIRILPGNVYLAPGNLHMQIEKDGANYQIRLNNGPLVSCHKPSVDVMFDSLADNVGKNALGILLTGMGKDGAQGLFNMRKAGAVTMAQDEQSCVVYGMPKEAVNMGAVQQVLSLDAIAPAITDYLKHTSVTSRL
ncbi:protein-glutamate methylesterase/protein-glutamine glutaminase [Neptunicella marina]|nr:chemotaxis response regulator protein-glutamate methylesterase [Neptunicella marina]